MNRNPTKVFTERGLYMLATVLHGQRAREVTFAIIETFYKVRSLKRELVELHAENDKEVQESNGVKTFTADHFKVALIASDDLFSVNYNQSEPFA